jgi:hypothetical protein
VLRVELVHRQTSGGDRTLVTQQVRNDVIAGDGGFPGDVDTVLTAPAVAAACGDQLVLRIKFALGSTPYTDFTPTLITP